MSAEITPEEIENAISFSRRAIELHESRSAPWAKAIVSLADERNALSAEVQRLHLERDAAIDERNAWRSGDQDSRIEADRLRGEVQRLTEEAREYRELVAKVDDAKDAEIIKLREESRRSGAGRVEVPELTAEDLEWCRCECAYGNWEDAVRAGWERLRSRLSPSPQPATGAALTCEDCDSREGCPKRGAPCMYHMSDVEPQPSADVVVVPREDLRIALELVEWSADPAQYKGAPWFDALRSSTNQKPTIVVGDCVTSEYRNDLGGFVRHSFSGAMPDAIIAQSWDYRTPIVDGSLDGLTRYSEDQVSMEDCLRAAERRKLATNHDAQDAGEGR